MKLGLICVIGLALAGCVTMSGTYVVSAHDSSGKNLNEKMLLTAEGAKIYTARNALCLKHPKAIVIIKDVRTSEELKSESPYQCP